MQQFQVSNWNILLLILLILNLGCLEEGKQFPTPKITSAPILEPEVSRVSLKVDKLIIEGIDLQESEKVFIANLQTGYRKDFKIKSKEFKKIVAQNIEDSPLPTEKLLSLIISSAEAQTIIPITFIPATNSINSRALQDLSISSKDIEDGAIHRLKMGLGPDDNPSVGDVLVWDGIEFKFSGPVETRAASPTSGVQSITLGKGIVNDGDTITDSGAVTIDVGETGDPSFTKIPYFNSSNELSLDSTAKLLFKESTTNFSISSDGTFKIKNETDSSDLLIVEANGNTTLKGDLVVLGTNLTVDGESVCLSDGTNCPASANPAAAAAAATATGVNSISTDSTIIQGGTAQDVTLSVNVGTGADQIVQLDGASKLPAVDGSELLNVGKITEIVAGAGLSGGGTSGVVTLDATGTQVGPGGVQEWKPRLDNLGTLNYNDNGVIIGNGSEFEVQAGITFQDSVGLLPGRDIMPYNQDLDGISGLNFTLAGEYPRYEGTSTGWGIAQTPTCPNGELLTADGMDFKCSAGTGLITGNLATLKLEGSQPSGGSADAANIILKKTVNDGRGLGLQYRDTIDTLLWHVGVPSLSGGLVNKFSISPTDRLDTSPYFVIQQDGKIGMGNTSPSYTLDVSGTVRATEYLYSSDKRFKENIEVVEGALEKILSLRGVSYNQKKGGAKSYGFVAQEIEKVFPELVFTDDLGFKSVSYAKLLAPVIEAIKEQQQLIENKNMVLTDLDELKKENASLRASLESQNKKIEEILKKIK